MTTPIVEQIAEEIRDRLDEIKIVNGFNYDLTAARPNRQELSYDQTWKDRTAVLFSGPKTLNDRKSGNPSIYEWRQDFVIDVYGYEDDKETDTVETRLHKMGADVEKKLMEDPQRNKLALKTELDGGMIVADPDRTGIAVKIYVIFRVREDDPYTSAT